MKHLKLFSILLAGLTLVTLSSCCKGSEDDNSNYSNPSIDNDGAISVGPDEDIHPEEGDVTVTPNGSWTSGEIFYWAAGDEDNPQGIEFTPSDFTSGSKVFHLTGLRPGTTYYVRYVLYNENGEYWSRTISFTTPSSATPDLNPSIPGGNIPSDGSIGVLKGDDNSQSEVTPDGNGGWKGWGSISGKTTIYAYWPYSSGATSRTYIPVTAGRAFWYAIGEATVYNPRPVLTFKNPLCNVVFNFKSITSCERQVYMSPAVLRNSSTSTHDPIAKAGIFSFATCKVTPIQNHDASFTAYPKLDMQKVGNTATSSFNYLIPTSYPGEAELFCTFTDNQTVSFTLPTSAVTEWTAGNTYTYNIEVSYTSKGVELYVGSITVEEWKTGKTTTITVNP